ncbi:MAG TPA: glutathione S-transferase family protein [Gammaproteobacteria bacterium]|nr:glutathione S-transferase family protein [Gammaproteobacteria bacterium]
MNNNKSQIDFYHWSRSRSTMVRALLEELNADYTLHLVNIEADEQHTTEYRAINPMGKVPAIVHDGALVTEVPAIYIYLADLFPEAGMAPTIGDAMRGPYLRWLVFYGSCFEPALLDRTLEREPPPRVAAGYGDYDSVIKTLTDQLQRSPYLLGEWFTAADVLWGRALYWATSLKLIEEQPVIRNYIDRVMGRPAIKRALKKDAA